jgi:hypothetical protein
MFQAPIVVELFKKTSMILVHFVSRSYQLLFLLKYIRYMMLFGVFPQQKILGKVVHI